METKYVRVPFEVKLAKKITNGEIEGRIVTRSGNNVRILCFDRKGTQLPIVALIEIKCGEEDYFSFYINGDYDMSVNSANDLMLEIPEYMTFKDGDIVKLSNDTYVWLSIIKNIGFDKDFCRYFTEDYVSILINDGDLDPDFDSYSDAAEIAERPTEEEKQKLIDALKQNEDTRAKECLKKLGIEVKPKCEFKPFDKVLVRESKDFPWRIDLFSHIQDGAKPYVCLHCYWKYCIPYEGNEHLLGTTDML